MSEQVRGRFQALRSELRSVFLEREPLIDAALAALVAGQHVLIVGPPGTAKSAMAARLCEAIDGARGFQWLLTRFTTPEELFGPVSLKALEQDRYLRITDGKLPRAHVVFLDEVFKASSAILNALLTVLNERVFHNGDHAERVPLMTLFGATNELPEEDELLALYDRFLVRVVVDYLTEDFRFLRLLTMPEPALATRLALEDVTAARAAAATVQIGGDVLRDLAALRRALQKRGVIASDRRWRQSVDLLRAQAWLAGRTMVGFADLTLLEHVLWGALEERAEVHAALDELLTGELGELRKLLFQARELRTYPDRHPDDEAARSRAALEAYTKLNLLLKTAQGQGEAAMRRGRDRAEIEAMLREIEALRDELVTGYLRAPLQ